MNIKAIRESRSVSQKALGEVIGVAENTVASWEKGRNAPPGDKVAAMARFLRCSTDELLLDDSEREIAPELQPVLRRFNGLPESRKPLALRLMASILAAIENNG